VDVLGWSLLEQDIVVFCLVWGKVLSNQPKIKIITGINALGFILQET
jgi:hypothetical protein